MFHSVYHIFILCTICWIKILLFSFHFLRIGIQFSEIKEISSFDVSVLAYSYCFHYDVNDIISHQEGYLKHENILKFKIGEDAANVSHEVLKYTYEFLFWPSLSLTRMKWNFQVQSPMLHPKNTLNYLMTDRGSLAKSIT